MRVISWNLLHGQSLPPAESSQDQALASANLREIAKLISADVIALQEVLLSEEIGKIDGLVIDQFSSQLETLT